MRDEGHVAPTAAPAVFTPPCTRLYPPHSFVPPHAHSYPLHTSCTCLCSLVPSPVVCASPSHAQLAFVLARTHLGSFVCIKYKVSKHETHLYDIDYQPG